MSSNKSAEFNIPVTKIVESYKWALEQNLIPETMSSSDYKAAVEANETFNFTD
jgi:hypothetical protein